MVFSGFTFLLLFFPIVFILLLLSRRLRYQNTVLLVSSLLFYAWGEPKYIVLMIAVTAVNYFCALPIGSETVKDSAKKALLVLCVIVNLGSLIYFKYTNFLLNTVFGLFGSVNPVASIRLPIGISFYTFQALTYTVDVYRGKSPVQRDPFKLLLYVACFPQLIAGPIVQYSDIAAQLDDRRMTKRGICEGFPRFAVGLAKKAIVANLCGTVLEEIGTAGSADFTVCAAWVTGLAYTLQIYFDFSAYSDMAIGMGKMFGFDYKENFNYPYMADSVTDFWRRWHISLGSFFRDYVYIPLGGNRVKPARHILNLLIVWGLTGIWHGASWNFLCWGLLYGVLLILEKYALKDLLQRIPGWIRRPVVFFFVMVGFIIFYYEDLSLGLTHILALFGIGTASFGKVTLGNEKTYLLTLKYIIPLALAGVFSTPLLKNTAGFVKTHWTKAYPFVAIPTLILLLALSLCFLVGQSYNPFIYFRF